jgi:two-component system, OmpR family, sensor kinase
MENSEHDISELFERFLQLPTGNLELALSGAADLIAKELGADKVDAFLHDPERSSLVAIGSSHQPLSALQKKSGLDVLPIANGGRVVQVFQSGEPHVSGATDRDEEEVRGIREVLGVRSQIGVALELGGKPVGVLAAASQTPSRWGPPQLRFMLAIARWVGIVAHRAQLVEELARLASEEGRRAAADELVTTVAHDLRNYIAPIQLRLDALRRRARQGQRADDLEDAEHAVAGVVRIDNLISDLLDVARLDHGLLELAPESVDLGELARDVAVVIATPDRPVHVEPAEPVRAHVDRARVRQVLENLVANALRHGPEGAAITVSLRSEQQASGTWARIDVVDEGKGIPEQLLPRIFDRFVRGKQSRGAGLGLGLFLAKRIAIAHGGDLTVESSHGGARFILRLPIEG